MKKPFKNRQSGFTLIEVLVVVIIVAILAAVAFPIYQSYVKSAYASDAQATIGAIMNASKMYFQDTGMYPSEVTADLEPKYIQIDKGTSNSWEFTLEGGGTDQPPATITATSTDLMKQGAGKVVTFTVETGRFSGFGFDENVKQ